MKGWQEFREEFKRLHSTLGFADLLCMVVFAPVLMLAAVCCKSVLLIKGWFQ